MSSETSYAELAPGLAAILYISNDGLFVRPILRLPRIRLEEMLEIAAHHEVMSRARQIGTAIQLFADDHDENLPPLEDLSGLLDPYLRSQGALEGFVPTYSARSLRDIADPANTILGYIEKRRGRAMVLADGSVRFAFRR